MGRSETVGVFLIDIKIILRLVDVASLARRVFARPCLNAAQRCLLGLNVARFEGGA